jgi:hypothetical protein
MVKEIERIAEKYSTSQELKTMELPLLRPAWIHEQEKLYKRGYCFSEGRYAIEA